jgi:hypothetical protein
MIKYSDISKLKGKVVKIKFTTRDNIDNEITTKLVDTRRGFKNDTIKVIFNDEMDYYIDTSKIISIKIIKK